MHFRNTAPREDKIELQMTAMIDIVFQLLIFFIMTFKIVALEGDFNINMPLAAESEVAPPPLIPPIKVRMQANADGSLAALSMGEAPLTGMQQLHDQIVTIVGGTTGPGGVGSEVEVELDCDYGLDYQYVIMAITAISGYFDEQGQIQPLVDKIKFAPPRPEG